MTENSDSRSEYLDYLDFLNKAAVSTSTVLLFRFFSAFVAFTAKWAGVPPHPSVSGQPSQLWQCFTLCLAWSGRLWKYILQILFCLVVTSTSWFVSYKLWWPYVCIWPSWCMHFQVFFFWKYNACRLECAPPCCYWLFRF